MVENKQLNKKNFSFVVLVGGLGSRIKHLYPNKPKPLVSIHNKPFLYWLIKEIKELNFKNVIYASGYRSEQIENWVNNNEFKDLNQKIVKEQKKLGTAGSIFNLIDMCKENLIILNGDSFLAGGIKKLLESINLKHSSTLVCHHMKNTSRFGRIVFNQKNQLINFLEKEKSGPGYINSGIYFFKKKKIIEYKTSGYMSLENQLIPNMIKNNEKINIIKIHKPKFIDIGTEDSILESKKKAEQILSYD
jgi:D-glycero-alpha-D-manno-heptose 1-phosphate guanylyltransferase